MTRMRCFVRKSRAALAVACTGLFLAAASVSAGGAAKLFTGGGYGPTPELAVRAAIEDGQTSASAEQLYTCVLVGEPQVFGPRPSPRGGVQFNAEAIVSCTP
jgi:hypothetical protein